MSMGTGILRLGEERLGHEIDRSTPSIAKARNEWNYTSSPPARLHGVHRNNFDLLPLPFIFCKSSFRHVLRKGAQHYNPFKLLHVQIYNHVTNWTISHFSYNIFSQQNWPGQPQICKWETSCMIITELLPEITKQVYCFLFSLLWHNCLFTKVNM